MRRFRLFLSVSIGCFFLAFFTLTAWGAQEIRIGVLGPMKFDHGAQQAQTATYTAEEINASGGIEVGDKTYRIKVIKVDSNEFIRVVDAVSAMERLITLNKVDFLMGGHRSEAVLAMQEIMADYKKVWINTGSGDPKIPGRVKKDYDRYKYYFRIWMGSVDFGAVAMAQLNHVLNRMKDECGIEKPKVAVLAEKAAWTDATLKVADSIFLKMGIAETKAWRVSPMATDLAAELSAIKSWGAHIIWTLFTSGAGTACARQYGQLQIPAAFVGNNLEGMKDGFWEATSGMANYVGYLDFLGGMDLPITEKTSDFMAKYKEKHGKRPGAPAATLYEGMYILKDAIERAGTLDTDAVIAALEKTDRIGILGRNAFNDISHREPHHLTWGPGYYTGVGIQWIDGKRKVFWPDGGALLGDKRWVGFKYKGTMDFQLPPWVTEYWKAKK
ncbi:MAG: ABC transporter substrate-binding protein [Desulfatiglans sp.]|jgi:branched-chain amino acid transport system substrate-binding protein|nr:ABC transporter substrate-binding protein [Thermodesulfobacteriota bacterium]MEE4354153.1 ABC transporter substrate-binding protein [Desulfatiglans sp.]